MPARDLFPNVVTGGYDWAKLKLLRRLPYEPEEGAAELVGMDEKQPRREARRTREAQESDAEMAETEAEERPARRERTSVGKLSPDPDNTLTCAAGLKEEIRGLRREVAELRGLVKDGFNKLAASVLGGDSWGGIGSDAGGVEADADEPMEE